MVVTVIIGIQELQSFISGFLVILFRSNFVLMNYVTNAFAIATFLRLLGSPSFLSFNNFPFK